MNHGARTAQKAVKPEGPSAPCPSRQSTKPSGSDLITWPCPSYHDQNPEASPGSSVPQFLVSAAQYAAIQAGVSPSTSSAARSFSSVSNTASLPATRTPTDPHTKFRLQLQSRVDTADGASGQAQAGTSGQADSISPASVRYAERFGRCVADHIRRVEHRVRLQTPQQHVILNNSNWWTRGGWT